MADLDNRNMLHCITNDYCTTGCVWLDTLQTYIQVSSIPQQQGYFHNARDLIKLKKVKVFPLQARFGPEGR